MQHPFNSPPAQDRIVWIDIFKGIAISFVVVGHLRIPAELRNFIHIFHMYAFFFVSGMMCKPYNSSGIATLSAKYVRQLYIPYWAFSLLWNVFVILQSTARDLAKGEFVFDLSASFTHVLKTILALVYGTDGTFGIHMGPAWFLMGLFSVKVCYAVLQKVFKDDIRLLGLTSAVFFVAGYLSANRNELPISLLPACTGIAFYCLGHILKPLTLRVANRTTLPLGILMVLSWVACYYCSLAAGEPLLLVYNKLPAHWLAVVGGAVSGICALVLTSKMAAECVMKSRPTMALLLFLGRNSLVLMGIQSPIRVTLQGFFGLLNRLAGVNTPLVEQNIVIFCVTLAISVPICQLLNSRFPFLVGAGAKPQRRNT